MQTIGYVYRHILTRLTGYHHCMILRLILILLGAFLAAPEQTRSNSVVIVTADGLRWQELFTGMDPLLMKEKAAGMENAEKLREQFWRPSPEQRREALMPFFWKTLAPQGM